MKKNILFIIPSPLFPLGASNYNSFRRIKELINYNYKITIICPKIENIYFKKTSTFENRYKTSVLDILDVKGTSGIKKHLKNILYNYRKLKLIIINYKPDLIHIVNPPDLIPFIVSGIAKNNNIPFIFHIADPGPESMATIFTGFKKYFFVFISFIIEKKVIKHSNALITVNDVLRKQIIKTRKLSKRNFEVVYNVSEKINIKRNSKSQNNTKNSMVYLGTLSSEMIGLKDFIYNYRKNQDWDKTIFNIIGDGPHKNELEKICSNNNLNNQIKFTGHLSFDQAMKIVSDSSLAILPYKDTPLTRISLPTKLFEYMSASKVVVCPNLSGLVEILGENYKGFYNVDKKNAIYKTINMFFKNKDSILKIGKENFQTSKKYTIEKEVHKIHELYNTILMVER